jgi:diguanylate cyclase (GGDEF)-like protein
MSPRPADIDLRRRRFLALFDACQALSSSLVLTEVMELICTGVGAAFGLNSVDIYEYSAERDELMVIWSFAPEHPSEAARFVGTVYSLESHPTFRRAFGEGQVVEYQIDDEDLARAEPELHEQMKDWGEKTVVEVGLRFGDSIIGLLSVGATAAALHFDDEEKELLIAFATTAAIAIHNARLYRVIEEQAIRDGLTGLFNHRAFYDRLGAELARSRRYGHAVGLLMMDIDDFKRFNDRHGHQAGDEVLRAVAGILVSELRRDIDAACRYGGEEFAVILPDTPLGARAVAERLRGKIAAATFTFGRDEVDTVTVSVGAATFPGPADSVDAFVAAADEALYAAKTAGKDRVAAAPGTD